MKIPLIVSAIGVGGTAAGLGIFLNRNNSFPTISNRISENKAKILVKDGDSRGWTLLWDAYKKENTK